MKYPEQDRLNWLENTLEPELRSQISILQAQNKVLWETVAYIHFRSEYWSNTGDNNSLREAMQSFAEITSFVMEEIKQNEL